MRIGDFDLKGNIILAPMAGVSDLPFRLLAHEYGADLVCGEMVSAKAVAYGNKNTAALLRISPEEGPVSMQLFGSDPEILGRVAERMNDYPFDILDFNMGCPVPKVVKNKEGSAMMLNPALAEQVLRAIVKNTSKPFTVKIRAGFDDEHKNAVEIAKICRDCGVSAIAVHARTREQYYSGNADWNVIKQVKDAVDIPVIGNGDIKSGEDAERMLRETGCDGIMIGRAARGNPWIFREIKAYLESGEKLPPPAPAEIKRVILRHGKMMLETKGEYTGIREMRKHLAWYTAGIPGSARFRERTSNLESFDEMERSLDELFLDMEGLRCYNDSCSRVT